MTLIYKVHAMAYRVYIKNDYKPEIVWGKPETRRRRPRLRAALLSCLLLFAIAGAIFFKQGEPEDKDTTAGADPFPITITPYPAEEPESGEQPALGFMENVTDGPPPATPGSAGENVVGTEAGWTDIRINRGDNMAQIFKRHRLSPRDLHDILNSHELAAALKHLRPGQVISLQTEGNELLALKFDLDLTQTLLVTKQAGAFTSEIITTELETRVQQAQGVINDSLYLAGQNAGLSDKLLMQLVGIYGWDIDYRLDIRKGDSFRVIYEEIFKNREKVAEGNVLAAEFNNRDRKIRAVRFVRENGQVDYFSDDGANMRKTFMRNPLDFSRISSHFNLRRKHPVLNRIRAHKGVDYAAATGTPIKATGDGKVQFIGNKGGYGRTIIVKHGEKYSTLYAHLSRFRKGLKRGQAVEQGQVIGYVGQSGLATGPHLHYEFRMDGVHRNPVTVALPQADSISTEEADSFRLHSTYLFALLDSSDAELLALYDPKNGL